MIHIHIGGAGVQIGDMLCQLYDKESKDMEYKKQIYFETQHGFVPRAAFFDFDDRTITQLKSKQFQERCLIKADAKEDSANTFANGYYIKGQSNIDKVEEVIRKLVEGCDKVNEFIYTFSISGGTGSGFTSRLSQTLDCDYQKIKQQAFLIFPSPDMNNNIVYPYNTVLALHLLISYFNALVLYDNKGMYQMLDYNIDIDNVDYQHINNLVAQTISAYTSIPRFNNKSNTEIFNSLIPYRRIQLLTPSYGPLTLINDYKRARETSNTLKTYIFNSGAQLLYQTQKPIFLSTSLIQRGLEDDLTKKYSNLCVNHFYQQKHNIFSSVSKNYQILEELQPLSRTNTLFANDANIKVRIEQILQQFNMLHRNRSYTHWFQGDGLEDCEFGESQEDLMVLIKDYEEVATPIGENCSQDDQDEEDYEEVATPIGENCSQDDQDEEEY